MATRVRAGKIKTRLYEITKRLVAEGHYTPEKAIQELISKHDGEIDEEIRDIKDYGLRSIAGVVRSCHTVTDQGGPDKVGIKIKEFETFVFAKANGENERTVVNVLDTTLEKFDSRVFILKKVEPRVNEAPTAERLFDEMREKGLNNWTLRQYLKSRRH